MYRYGGMSVYDFAEFASADRHAFEIVPTDRMRKFYLDYDHELENINQSAEVHDAVLADLQAKACADTESVCKPGRVALSGSWRFKGPKVKHNIRLVRPDRFFINHAAAVPMSTIA